MDLALPLAAFGFLKLGIELVAVAAGMEDDVGIQPQDFLGQVTGDRGEGRVDRDDAVLGIHDEDALGGGLKHGCGLPQLLLGLALLSDVL